MPHSHTVCRRRWVAGCHPPALSPVGAGPRCKEPAAHTNRYFTAISSQHKVLSKKSIHNQPSVPPKCLRHHLRERLMLKPAPFFLLLICSQIWFTTQPCRQSASALIFQFGLGVPFLNQPSRSFWLAVLRFTSRADLRAKSTELVWGKRKAGGGSTPKVLQPLMGVH